MSEVNVGDFVCKNNWPSRFDPTPPDLVAKLVVRRVCRMTPKRAVLDDGTILRLSDLMQIGHHSLRMHWRKATAEEVAEENLRDANRAEWNQMSKDLAMLVTSKSLTLPRLRAMLSAYKAEGGQL